MALLAHRNDHDHDHDQMATGVLPAGTTGLKVLLDYFCGEIGTGDPSVAVATSNPSGGLLMVVMMMMFLVFV